MNKGLIKALIYRKVITKNHIISPSSSPAKLGHLGHQFTDKLALQKVQSPTVSCASVSSSSPPILKPFRLWILEKGQALALGSNFALASSRTVPHRIKPTPSSENCFFDPLPTLSRLRTSLIVVLIPPILGQVQLVPCGPISLKDNSSRTIRDTNYNKDFRD